MSRPSAAAAVEPCQPRHDQKLWEVSHHPLHAMTYLE
jgi:hypothetical protein